MANISRETYGIEAFDFHKQGTQVFVKNEDDSFSPLSRYDVNPSLVSSSIRTAFGETSVAENFPYIQAAPTNNLLPANFRIFTANGGQGSISNKEFKVNTNTSVGAYGAIQSFRSVNYKPGEGGLARFTSRFASGGVSNSWQGIGLISIGDELSFGYSGQSFGTWYRHHGLAHQEKLTITSPAGGGETASVTVNGSLYSIPITAGSAQLNAYEISNYLLTGSSGFDVWQNDDEVYIHYKSDGLKTGTFNFSSSSASGTWSLITSGVTKTSEFTPQTSWNKNTMSSLDPTKGNVYQIKYQYLGYGGIEYAVEDPETSNFVPVHLLKYANANSRPSLENASLRMGMYVVSLGSTSDIEVFSGSMAAFSQGVQSPIRNPRAIFNSKSVDTTPTNIFTLRNKIAVNGNTNQSEIQPKLLTVFTTSAQGAIVELRTNPSVTGPTNFTDTQTNLVSEYDVTGTTVSASNGTLILSLAVPKDSSQVIDLENLRIRVPPSLSLCVSARVLGGAASTVAASLTWYEDI